MLSSSKPLVSFPDCTEGLRTRLSRAPEKVLGGKCMFKAENAKAMIGGGFVEGICEIRHVPAVSRVHVSGSLQSMYKAPIEALGRHCEKSETQHRSLRLCQAPR